MKAIKTLSIGVLFMAIATTAHAQTGNIVDSTLKNAAKNSALRNQLITDHSNDLQNKQQALADQLDLTLLNLKNIQTRIAAKTAEVAASGSDTSLVDAWLATSSSDIIASDDDIAQFRSSIRSADIATARTYADAAISSVNTARDDLQSALDALTAIL